MSRRNFLGGLTALRMVEASQSNSQARVQPGPAIPLIPKLSQFIVNATYDGMPPKAIETAKAAIMDCLGVAVAGGTESSARIAGRLAREEKGKEEATVYGQH